MLRAAGRRMPVPRRPRGAVRHVGSRRHQCDGQARPRAGHAGAVLQRQGPGRAGPQADDRHAGGPCRRTGGSDDGAGATGAHRPGAAAGPAARQRRRHRLEAAGHRRCGALPRPPVRLQPVQRRARAGRELHDADASRAPAPRRRELPGAPARRRRQDRCRHRPVARPGRPRLPDADFYYPGINRPARPLPRQCGAGQRLGGRAGATHGRLAGRHAGSAGQVRGAGHGACPPIRAARVRAGARPAAGAAAAHHA